MSSSTWGYSGVGIMYLVCITSGNQASESCPVVLARGAIATTLSTPKVVRGHYGESWDSGDDARPLHVRSDCVLMPPST
jgi:hypothetical protein